MTARKHTNLACFLLVAGLTAGGPASANGFVSAFAQMGLENLRFFFGDPDAFLVWDDVWYGEVTAYAQDTDSGADSDFDSDLGDDVFIDAEAQTAHVYSLAEYLVLDGANVAIDVDGDGQNDGAVEADTESDLDLTGKQKQADGLANANFDNFFFVATTNPLAPASVLTTIELDYAGLLDAFANEQGYFDVFAGAFLELLETDASTGWASDLVDMDEVFDSAAGTDTAHFSALNGTLTITADLVYYDTYYLYAEADSEVYGAVPVIGTLPLLLIGAGMLAWRRRGG